MWQKLGSVETRLYPIQNQAKTQNITLLKGADFLKCLKVVIHLHEKFHGIRREEEPKCKGASRVLLCSGECVEGLLDPASLSGSALISLILLQLSVSVS